MKKQDYEGAVFESDLTPTERIVALAYAHRCNYETGESVWSSHQSIATRTGLARRTVVDTTKALVTKKYLTPTENRPGKTTVYALSIPDAVILTGAGVCTIPEHQQGCETDSQVPVQESDRGVQEIHRGCETDSHDNIDNNLEDKDNNNNEPEGELEKVTFSKIIDSEGNLFNPEKHYHIDTLWGGTQPCRCFDDSSNSKESIAADVSNMNSHLLAIKEGKAIFTADLSTVDWAAAQRLMNDPDFESGESDRFRASAAAWNSRNSSEGDAEPLVGEW